MSAWNDNIEQIRDSILVLKKQLESEEPKDRLDAVSKIFQCIEFMKQSNMGWASLLTNPTMVNQLDEESLKDIYSKFRRIAIDRIDSDVDSINRYMINLLS